MTVKVTPAQKCLITTAIERTGGVIVFPASYSAWMRLRMRNAMVTAGLVHPGTTQVTMTAVRAVASDTLTAEHTAAHEVNGTTGGPRLEDVKDGDVVTYREFSLRSEKVVTRRARVHGCYIHEGTLRFEGSYVKKDGTRAAVQPRFGLYANIEARELVAINA